MGVLIRKREFLQFFLWEFSSAKTCFCVFPDEGSLGKGQRWEERSVKRPHSSMLLPPPPIHSNMNYLRIGEFIIKCNTLYMLYIWNGEIWYQRVTLFHGGRRTAKKIPSVDNFQGLWNDDRVPAHRSSQCSNYCNAGQGSVSILAPSIFIACSFPHYRSMSKQFRFCRL